MTETTNQSTEKDNKDKEKAKPREPRERRERGPPADGIPSKNKVMVANLPYDLSEEKVRVFTLHFPSKLHANNMFTAQGTLCCLRAILCQDRSSTNPPFHGQEAPSSQ